MRLILIAVICTFSFNAVAQFGSFNTKGSGNYWTKSGEKIEGEFKISYKTHTMVGESIVKHYVNGKKVGRLDLNSIESLIVAGDSFVIAHNFTLNRLASYRLDLVRVMLEGDINLYEHCRKVKTSSGFGVYAVSTSYLECTFVVRQKNSATFNGIATKNQFESLFIPLIMDNEQLKSEVLEMKKKDWISSVPYLVTEYNKGLK